MKKAENEASGGAAAAGGTLEETPPNNPLPPEETLNTSGEVKESDGGAVAKSEEMEEKPPRPRWRNNLDLTPIPSRIPPELIPPNAVDITLRQTGKLWKIPLEPGDPSVTLLPRRGNLAKIHYKSWLATDPSKTIFDSSALTPEDQEPTTLNIGERQVILAIDFGVATMTKRGEKAVFLSHYDLAYGKFSERKFDSSNIPNGSFICTEVTLVDIEDGTKLNDGEEGGIRREILALGGNGEEEGEAPGPLTSNSLMFVKLEGWKEGGGEKEVFLKEVVLPFTPCFATWGYYPTGEGYPIPGSLGGQLMALREADRILYSLEGDGGFEEGGEWNGVKVGKGEGVKFLVEVVEVEEILDPFVMSLKEKVEICGGILKEGTCYRTQGYWEAAACKFTRVKEYLGDAKAYLKKVPEDLGKRCDEMLLEALMGMAGLYGMLRGMEGKEALGYCDEAVRILEGSGAGGEMEREAYLLRARFHGEIFKDYGLARKDLVKVLEMTEEGLKQMKILEGGSGDGGKEAEGKKNLEEIRTNVRDELKKMEEAEKKCSGFVLKYVAPK